MSKNEIKPTSRKANIVVQDYGNEILIYDLIINKAFSLNETSALVWQECDGNKTISEISSQISRRLNSPINEDFVWLALEQLKKENLIESESEISSPFIGLSRREVIRKIGLASLVALPIISSLVAPEAVRAQSGCGVSSGRPNGCECTRQDQCATECCSSAPRTCVALGTKATGTPCIADCECASGDCLNAAPRRCL